MYVDTGNSGYTAQPNWMSRESIYYCEVVAIMVFQSEILQLNYVIEQR